MISKRARLLKPSPTLALSARAKELEKAGHQVVNLTVGEPDWATYPAAAEAGILAIKKGHTKYTPASGLPELREAIAEDFFKSLSVQYTNQQIVVGAGAKYVLYTALQMLCDQGDEVIIPAPFWVSYPTLVELAGGTPVILNCPESQKFKMNAAQLDSAVTDRTKALILCSPSNPTGVCYSQDELKELSKILLKHPKVVVISDDIYNQLTFSENLISPHLLHIAPELKERILVVNGAAKAFAMTGWRVGWGAGPIELMSAMADFLSQSTSNVCSVSQHATIAALKNCSADVAKARVALKQKMQSFFTQMNQIPGLSSIKPDGAFYLWVNVKSWLSQRYQGKNLLENSKTLSEILLNEYFLATVPGIEFGMEGYLRLSFATSQEQLDLAIDRFKKFQANLTA